jgi:4-oxalocrotonate tautomerase
MPILNVKISGPRRSDIVSQVSAMLLEHTSAVLGKKREVTAITFQFIDPQDWIIGGRPLSEQGLASFYLDIKVTDETNTKDEKARYLKAVFEGFGRLLGPVHDESYIYVEDVRAASYGYGGTTQEYRYQHPA